MNEGESIQSQVLRVTAITLSALALFLPYLTIQYDLNGIDEARSLEAGPVFHKNHMLYRPMGYAVYRTAQAAGYSGNSLAILQVMNALFGAIGIGLCYIALQHVVRDRMAALAGSFWLATTFVYWYFSTDAGYIMPAATFVLAALAAALYGRALSGAALTACSVFTWQASIFALPIVVRFSPLAARARLAVVSVVFIGIVYVGVGLSAGHYTPAALLNWGTTYGESGTLPQWGRWGWDRVPAAAMSALSSITPVPLAVWPGDFHRDMQPGRIAVDLSLIALGVLLVLAALKARRTAIYFLLGYALFFPFIIWWDPWEPKWFLIPNIFLAGFLTSGLVPWIQRKYARLLVLGCVMGIAGTNFVTIIEPRHSELGPDRAMAQCVAEKMSTRDLFVSAEWGWSDYLDYVHHRSSVNVINTAFSAIEEWIAQIRKEGGTVWMLDPATYSDSHIRWLTSQTGVTREHLAKLPASAAFTCFGRSVLRY